MAEIEKVETKEEEELRIEIEKEEMGLLKDRAKMLGITFPNNIKLATLREKVNEALAGGSEPKKNIDTIGKDKIKKEASKLIRIRLTSNDEKDREADGVLINVSNDIVNFKKFIKFDVAWHVPNMIYKMLLNKKIQKSREKRKKTHDVGTPAVSRETYSVKKYNIEVLPDLTPKELKALAEDQRRTNRV